ncbi:C-C motif chemokine 14-like [Sander lucioperca]|uniref:C-C motif chemokine 14-like n=1 Tax=Sander lucioperca TaxID=283035 RepID=UPI00125E940C|nr:C-C motif chemokine 14-like [Sander lucioperca]
MMKTFCFTLGLLLLTACCCNAMPQAVQFQSAPGKCCFKFYTRKIPLQRVFNITKTHSACQNQAFIVHTIKGIPICYRETFQWARDIYSQPHYTVGSGQQL